MIKKIFFLILTAAIFQSCDDKLYYSGKERILMQGRIVDQNNSPVQGIPVNIFVEKDDNDPLFLIGRSLEDEDIISYTTTDANGYYKMLMPRPLNQDNISLIINKPTSEQGQNTDYSNTVVTYISLRDADDYAINFSEQKLYRLQDNITITITVNNVPSNFNGKLLTDISGLINNKITTIQQPYYNQFYLYDTTYQNNFTTIKYTLNVAKNQTISFKYQRNVSTGATTEHLINVGNEPANYNVNY
ncbi:hypothetical protein GR160_03395 [Flavobacterium sp. Sd200]|uniref:hypothetical protein n=1 Tax=Flavobacterium sp. Sd200 TaxID=2692211 RepID=UPI001367DEC0|nr:hypothetical protein [Flavobacterium sp. Sd200]MXN90261.1 hypothetical protein [Flavobacterium sp. Sd200]